MRVGAFLFVVLTWLLVAVAPAHAQTVGLEYSEDVVFTVLDDSVRVELTATMHNTTQERRDGDTVFFSFFESFVFVAPADTPDISVTSHGQSLEWVRESLDADFDLITATLAEQLRSGESQSFEVTYTLPQGEIRSDSAFLSNPAHHGFPLWSFSDPGTGSLILRVPEDAELSELTESLEVVATSDGFVDWSPRNFDAPSDYFTFVNVVRDERLISTNLDVSGQHIEIRSWPGDTEWLDFARGTIEGGVPVLEDQIGLPIPEQGTLEVTESVTPFLYGYAGWYDPQETAIEIGNELDSGLMLHELSHAWFNESLIAQRWLSEGLAEEISWQANQTIGQVDTDFPTIPRRTDAGALALNDWGDPVLGIGNEEFRERELYGYNASWFVVRQLTEILGTEGLMGLLADLDSNSPTYSEDSRALLLNDWRRVLDLASNQTDAEGEVALDALWVEYVVDDDEAELLAQRREVRDQYLRFADRPLGWQVPAGIDEAMTNWRFDDARVQLVEANRVLDLQRRVIDQAGLAGLDASEAGRNAYEQPTPNFADALSVLAEQEEAITSVIEVRELAQQPLSLQERWGTSADDFGGFVQRAESAYSANRFADVVSVRDRLMETRQDATAVGSSRLLWIRLGLGAAIVLVVYALFALVRYRRRVLPPARDESHVEGIPTELGGV